MAERRMFSKRIVRSAKFLKMPVSSRELYWQLGIEADDDGIVESFNVMRMTGATEDDLRVLVSKGFVQVLNEDLVAYITDWNENNKLRADRKVDSIYKHLLLQINPDAQLIQAKPRADTKKLTGQSMDNQWTSNGPHSIGKDSIVQESIGEISIVEDKDTRNKVPYEKIKDLFHEICISYPKILKLNDTRKKTIKARYLEYGGDIEIFKELFAKAEESNFLKGNNDNNWKASFDWLIKPQNMIKVLEGNYTNKQQTFTKQPIRQEPVPDWFGKENQVEQATPEETEELEDLLSEFKSKKEDLQSRLKEKYGKKGTDE